MTVLIAGGGTGGHLIPALTIAKALRDADPGRRVVLAGAERGVEADVLPGRDFPYELLPAEPLYRRQWWKNIRWPLLAARLLRRVDALLERERPDLVIGTGGYVSAPVLWRAAGKGIPVAIQEQNAYPGLATRLVARRAREIWLGVPEAARRLRPGKRTLVVDTGNPIAPPDHPRQGAALARFGIDPNRPVVLVTGGSQGALAINRATAEWIESGKAEGIQILWAAGKATYSQFQRLHRPPGVQLFDFLDPMADAYSVADLAISRAGMMTVAELLAWGIPSVLIPLPTSAADHQTANARVTSEAGAAIHFPQSGLDGDSLARMVVDLLGDSARRDRMAVMARSRGRPDAVAQILTRIGILSG